MILIISKRRLHVFSRDKAIHSAEDKIPDPKKINYCGYTCPEDCKFLVASVKNDLVLKKEAYEIWEMKERFGVVEFEADKIFCFGCKGCLL